MLSNIIGILVALYGGYQLFMNGGTPQEIDFWIKSFVALLGGGGYLAYNNFSTIKSSVTSLVNKDDSKPTVPEKPAENVFVPEEFNKKDTEALYHLRQRCYSASSKEGIETCAKLAGIIFTLDLVKEEVQANEKK